MPPILIEAPDIITVTHEDHSLSSDKMWQVVIWNDEVHSMNQVIEALMVTFGHPLQIAQKIMKEANDLGKAIAEVEDREKALLHKEQLMSAIPPFTVHIEEID